MGFLQGGRLGWLAGNRSMSDWTPSKIARKVVFFAWISKAEKSTGNSKKAFKWSETSLSLLVWVILKQ
jgi:hypothetical protein